MQSSLAYVFFFLTASKIKKLSSQSEMACADSILIVTVVRTDRNQFVPASSIHCPEKSSQTLTFMEELQLESLAVCLKTRQRFIQNHRNDM